MSSVAVPKLFQPIKLGRYTLAHRVVLAPLTRMRANAAHVHGDLAVEYYTQRALVPGTLLISEGTLIAAKAGGYPNVPGIWSEEQITAWKRVTDAVHAKGSRIFCQLWAIGRGASVDVLAKEDPSYTPVSASAIPIGGHPPAPHPLTIPEIQEYVSLFAIAAQNAVRGGFDGVEVHCANGYLIDQFLQDVSNKRTDAYGGSVEKRCRFALEIIDAVVDAIGADRVGFRISPWSLFQDMRMADPKPTFAHLVASVAERHPDLAYLHAIESRENETDPVPGESNDFVRKLWAPRRFISASGFTRETAFAHAEESGDLISFGRAYIANPDLPLRLAKNLPLTVGARSTYYLPGATGYTDYSFADDSLARN